MFDDIYCNKALLPRFGPLSFTPRDATDLARARGCSASLAANAHENSTLLCCLDDTMPRRREAAIVNVKCMLFDEEPRGMFGFVVYSA